MYFMKYKSRSQQNIKYILLMCIYWFVSYMVRRAVTNSQIELEHVKIYCEQMAYRLYIPDRYVVATVLQ